MQWENVIARTQSIDYSGANQEMDGSWAKEGRHLLQSFQLEVQPHSAHKQRELNPFYSFMLASL